MSKLSRMPETAFLAVACAAFVAAFVAVPVAACILSALQQ